MLRLMGGPKFESARKNESHPVGKMGQVAMILPKYIFVTLQGILCDESTLKVWFGIGMIWKIFLRH